MSDPIAQGLSSPSHRCGPAGAALGLASAGARELIRLPLTVLKLPLTGLQQALVFGDAVRQGYEDLAIKGLRRIGFLRGTDDFDGDSAAGYASDEPTPETADGAFAQFDPDFDTLVADTDLADQDPELASFMREVGTDIGADLAAGAPTVEAPATDTSTSAAGDHLPAAAAAALSGETGLDAGDAAAAAADLAGTPLAVTAAAPTQPREVPAEASAGPESVDIVTRAVVAAEEAAVEDLPDVHRADLPIENFDSVTAGSLRGRLRRLDLGQLKTLRLYEQEHGRRLPILTLLENRIAKLEAAATA